MTSKWPLITSKMASNYLKNAFKLSQNGLLVRKCSCIWYFRKCTVALFSVHLVGCEHYDC